MNEYEYEYDLTLEELRHAKDCDECGREESATLYDMDASGETIHLCAECAGEN